jgi:hypothetical protein
MDLSLLVGNWEATGLLEGLEPPQKLRLSLKLEVLARHLLNLSDQPNYKEEYGDIETLIFPLVRRMCAELNWEEKTYTFYGGVNPIRVLEEFKTWWNGDANSLRMDLNVYQNIDVEAELLGVYSDNFGFKFRNDNYTDNLEGPIKPDKFIKRHKL